MTAPDQSAPPSRGRRAPPPFRRVEVLGTQPLGARMCRVTLGGPELESLEVLQPASSVRVLLPRPGDPEPVIPSWAGNEFLLAGGLRPTIRTLTPRRWDPVNLELDVHVVLHDRGAASDWAKAAVHGSGAAVSGTARGYDIDEDAEKFFLAGDETAIPAIGQLLESVPPDRTVQVVIEVALPEGRIALPSHPNADIRWVDLPPGATPGEALVGAVRDFELESTWRIWVAGEAAGVQRVRRLLFEDRGLPRTAAIVRGYWKHGRRAEDAE